VLDHLVSVLPDLGRASTQPLHTPDNLRE